MSRYLSYLLNRFRYPGLSDFTEMGLGIEARFERCKSFWEPHLRLSMEFQRSTFTESDGRIAVLGAGRLLDCDLEFLLERFNRIELIDADPTAIQFLKAKLHGNSAISVELLELTGSLDPWRKDLQMVVDVKTPSYEKAISTLRDLRVFPAPLLDRRYDCVLSLNLLGQIPIYWRERVETLLEKHLGITMDERGDLPLEVEDAISRSCFELQAQHLSLLETVTEKKAVLITDRFFHYYKNDISPWTTYPALYLDIEKHLRGLEVNSSDSWLWHCAPQGIESDDYGAIHEIRAVALGKVQT